MSIKAQLRRQPEPGKAITGQELTDIARFAEDTRYMIVFDVLTWDCPTGDKGERVRAFLSDKGYGQAIESEKRGEMKIVRRARVRKGDVFYDTPEHDREEY
jgi:hypothetical protein